MKPEAAPTPEPRQPSAATLFWGLTAQQAAILAAIVIATIAIYLPSLRNGWVFDDWQEFVQNNQIHSWSFVSKSFIHDIWWFRDPDKLPQSAYYRPLENAWFAANTLLFGMRPVAWHLAKLVLHALVVILCFRVAQLLTGEIATALLSAAIFAVMPAHVEAVVWASSIPEPLSTAFELGALIFVIGRKPGWSRGLFAALILYACATLTHESAILFPLIIAAYAFLIERRRAGESIRLAAPFIAIALAYLCARLYVLGADDFFGAPYSQTLAALGWAKLAPPHGALDIVLTAPAVLLEYLGVLTMPGIAGPAHDVNWIASAARITIISVGVLAVLAAIASAAAWRSSHRNLYVFCAAWSLLSPSAFDETQRAERAGPGPPALCAVVWMEPCDCNRGGAARRRGPAGTQRGGRCDGGRAGRIRDFSVADRALLARQPDILYALRGGRSAQRGLPPAAGATPERENRFCGGDECAPAGD